MKHFVLVMLMATVAAVGQTKQQQQHAHAHGAAKINIGIEGSGGTVEFESAADPVIGFEHKPRTAADQKKVDAALTTLKTRFAEMVILPAALGCKFENTRAQFVVDGQHAEVHAEFTVRCVKSLKGAEVKFGEQGVSRDRRGDSTGGF